MGNPFRGMATFNIFVDDLAAAEDFYSVLFNQEPYFRVPGYIEYRFGDYSAEFGVRVDSDALPGPARSRGLVYWAVNDIDAAMANLEECGGFPKEPKTPRGNTGFITASFLDPWGNEIGLIKNPHYEEIRKSFWKKPSWWPW
jgi:Predicted enzyme related to lactoylglutathione lyase